MIYFSLGLIASPVFFWPEEEKSVCSVLISDKAADISLPICSVCGWLTAVHDSKDSSTVFFYGEQYEYFILSMGTYICEKV
jgi:hypothetical protein